ncbi:calpain-9-like isoform X1 [Rhopilema esculentum]|uniref:calpain-9-like isoform X1 n=1 Tax=Rhopilema esculentum TaxID=499914 RepID=UPI0031DFF1EE
MATFTVKQGGTRKVYSAGGSKKTSGYHLGKPSDAIDGSRTPSDAAPYKGQKFQDIKNQCLRDGVLFEDPEFPAIESSLFFSGKKPPRPFVWTRPKEIVSNPEMFVGGASRFDISQGMLGDCWLLAAIATLTQYESLLYQVVPPDQSFTDGYAGIFRFRFWQYGRWEEVVIDDLLPTYNGKLVFVHSAERGEMWSALLEKAYAKLNGSYEALKGGQTSEAMEDFTGGVTETFDLRKAQPKLEGILLKSVARQSLMCCSIEAKPNEIEAKLENGLIKGHAYSITGVKKINLRGNPVTLVRIRNPWGNEREWKGAWSDGSREWGLLSEGEKRNLGITFDDDGEFWMAYNDFTSEFTRLEVCMLSPDSAGDVDRKTWEANVYQGSWQKGVSAGGCRNFPDSFHANPQFKVKLEDPDSDDEEDNCTLVIGVIQKNRRKIKKLGAQNLTIGFAIYKLGDDADQYADHGRMGKDFFLYNKSTARSDNFINSREVTGRFSLPPGEYAIVPSTFKPQEEGDFLIRMFSEKGAAADTLDTQTTIEYRPSKEESHDSDMHEIINCLGEPTQDENDALDNKLSEFFKKVAGEDGEIDSFELQGVITAVFKKEFKGTRDFSLEACRSMVAMMDKDRSGKLVFGEFKDLWFTIMKWKTAFKDYDKDGSGDMDAIELRGALAKLGFKLSTPALSSLVLRYANKKGHISFDDFLQICCRIRSCFESYLSYQGRSFSLDDYIMSAIYT